MCLCLVGLVSCSKDDNKDDDVDPIFSLEYKPLKSLKELETNDTYYYAGIKIGDRKVGLLPSSSTSCTRHDRIYAKFGNNTLNYIVFYRNSRGCDDVQEVRLVKNVLENDGILHTVVLGSLDKLDQLVIDDEGRIPLEIGFQGEYLRIEDRMSNYKRTKQNEKVYLYFAKNKLIK